tara:strand:- start:7083 stop:7217 length:135 start_codon:yes stop_codon:yes gene_type:complete
MKFVKELKVKFWGDSPGKKKPSAKKIAYYTKTEPSTMMTVISLL